MTEQTPAPKKVAAKVTRPKRNGPAPLPIEQHRRRGNPGKKALPSKDSTVAIPMAKTTPTPPRKLGKEGQALWDRAWTAGKTWLSADGDVDILLLLCEAMDERTELRKLVLTEGDWRQRSALRSLEKQVIDKLQLLGFTPSDRGRLGVAEVKPEDEMAKYRARVAGQ